MTQVTSSMTRETKTTSTPSLSPTKCHTHSVMLSRMPLSIQKPGIAMSPVTSTTTTSQGMTAPTNSKEAMAMTNSSAVGAMTFSWEGMAMTPSMQKTVTTKLMVVQATTSSLAAVALAMTSTTVVQAQTPSNTHLPQQESPLTSLKAKPHPRQEKTKPRLATTPSPALKI